MTAVSRPAARARPGRGQRAPVPDGSGSTGSGSGTGTTDNKALQQALADANQALKDRQAAYAKNDLVAAAQADARLQAAIQRAVAAGG